MAGEPRTLLMVEDEAGLRNAVRLYLEMEGYRVVTVASGEEGLEKVRQEQPDAILLDVMLPGMDGFETLRRLRTFSSAPVLMLTAKGDESDVVKGLRLGADDYVRKPFGQAELASRIQAVLRRTGAATTDEEAAIVVDDYLTLDFVRHDIFAGGEKVQLRPTEYRLLYQLASNPGRVQTYEQLLGKVRSTATKTTTCASTSPTCARRLSRSRRIPATS